eukprot:2643607-Pyramimonas_sp.AAC.4
MHAYARLLASILHVGSAPLHKFKLSRAEYKAEHRKLLFYTASNSSVNLSSARATVAEPLEEADAVGGRGVVWQQLRREGKALQRLLALGHADRVGPRQLAGQEHVEGAVPDLRAPAARARHGYMAPAKNW